MQFTLSQAAKEVGISKGTLSRALSSGKVSAERREDGSYQIDASELFRVFPMKPPETRLGTELQPHDTLPNPPADRIAAAVETAVLRTKLEAAEAKIADMVRVHEEDRETVQDLRKRLDQEQDERRNLQRQIAAPAPERAQEAPALVEDLRTRLEEAKTLIATLRVSERPVEASTVAPVVVESARPSRGFLARLLGR